MSGLVDARNVKQQDLSKLLRGGERARRHQALVEALLERRILTRVGEGLDRLYFLLSHRSVLDYWQRATEWLKQTAPRLKVKAKLIPHYQLEDTSDRWHEDDLDDFAGLALNWIGSGEEDDGRALDYLKSRLCARLDPAQVGLWAKTGLARLPFAALFAGDTSFFGDLLDKCMASPVWADIAPGLVIAISSEGEVAFLEAALDGADTAALCNTVDEETGAFPLLLAAQNGHAEVAGLLLDKDAEPNRVNEDGLFPLLMAAAAGAMLRWSGYCWTRTPIPTRSTRRTASSRCCWRRRTAMLRWSGYCWTRTPIPTRSMRRTASSRCCRRRRTAMLRWSGCCWTRTPSPTRSMRRTASPAAAGGEERPC